MGILSQIAEQDAKRHSEKFDSDKIHSDKLDSDELPEPPPGFCSACEGAIFWQSVYGDGIWRCGACDQPPTFTLATNWHVDGIPIRQWTREKNEESPDANIRPWLSCELESEAGEMYYHRTVNNFGWPLFVLKKEYWPGSRSRSSR